MVVPGAVPQCSSIGTALCPLCLHPDRRHLPQHGCQSGGSSDDFGYTEVEDHVPYYFTHGKPAILSTILLVFGSAMGSYPVPHYLGLTTLSTKYISMNSKYTGEASILAIIMMIFGVAILLMNQMSLKSRKNYTTVTGKSGQISKINLGKSGNI